MSNRAETVRAGRREWSGYQQGDRGDVGRRRRVKAIAQELKAKGVTFEHYEMPGLTLQGDIHVGYGMQVAWFKDPDGNILNLVSR